MTYQEPDKNYTKIPNPILDVMGEMSESELKLTLCLVRYTFGYHTDRAQMTYDIMQERAKMSRGAVYRAIELVEERGFFRRGRKSFWFVNSSKFEPCYVNNDSEQAGKSSESERNHAGKSSNFEPTKRKEEKEIENKTRADETLIALFEGMTAFTPPYETTDAYAEDWLAPAQAILSQSKDFAEAEARITYAIQHLRKIRYTIVSPKSILKTALNWQPGDKAGTKQAAPHANGANGSAADTAVWDIALAHARRGDTNFTDPALRAAVVAYGWPKLQAIPEGKENFYKSDFMRIYHDKSAATPQQR